MVLAPLLGVAAAPNLTLEGARAVLGPALRVGTIFSVGEHRFRISHVEATSPRPGKFIVEIETEPME
jgi:hypothetical protein